VNDQFIRLRGNTLALRHTYHSHRIKSREEERKMATYWLLLVRPSVHMEQAQNDASYFDKTQNGTHIPNSVQFK
jgi:hypothetical protein